MTSQQFGSANETTISPNNNTSNIEGNMVSTLNSENIENNRMTGDIIDATGLLQIFLNRVINISSNVR